MSKGNAFISFISFFSIAGIALGLIALITVVSVMNGFESRLKTSMLSLLPDIEISLPTEQKTDPKVVELIRQLETIEHVKRIDFVTNAEAILVSNQALEAVQLQGVGDNNSANYQSMLSNENLNTLSEHKYGVAMTRYLAAKLDVRIGDTVRVMIPSRTHYTPAGRMPVQRLFTLVSVISDPTLDPNLVFANDLGLKRLLRFKEEQAVKLSIKLDDPFNVENVVSRTIFKDLEVTDWRKSQGVFFSAVAMEKRMMSMLLGLIIMVAVFNILSALAMMVSEKRAEVAILQTQGLTPWQVVQVFMVQGLYNGVIGTIIGTLTGLLIANNINTILTSLGLNLLGNMELPTLFIPFQLGVIVLGALLMSFLATLYPALKAASLQPAEVLRYE